MQMPMIKTFTKNELVRFLYRESKEKQNTEIKHALLTNDNLAEEVVQMENLREELENFRVKAPEKIVRSILEYSRSLQPGG